VKSPDGSNIPFIVQSDVTYENLHIIVAEKLRCFPGLLKLRYRLESDRAKAGATSIQSEEELHFFKDRMRGLIVPQRLPSGKISTCALKPVLVYFKDANEENVTITTNKAASAASSKKVRVTHVSQFVVISLHHHQALSHTSVVSTKESDSQNDSFNELQQERKKVLAALQVKW
jgi:hypothetical protein